MNLPLFFTTPHQQKRRFGRLAHACVAWGVLVGGSVGLPAAAMAQQSAVAAATPLHAITESFQSGGVRRCLGKVNLISHFLTGQARSGSAVFPLGAKPDDAILSVSMEILNTNSSSYVGATYAPKGDDCVAVYEAVTYWPNKCEEMMALPAYSVFKPTGALQQNIKTMANNANMRMIFMPAGSGCVVIKKEAVQ